jgi:transposase
VIHVTVDEGPEGLPQVTYELDAAVPQRIAETRLGKTILISNRKEWSDDRIIEAYRSHYLIEAVFKEMKDRTTGSWWPLNPWTDSKLRVHGLSCSMAQLLRSVMWRRVRRADVKISLRRLLAEWDEIRQVITRYPKQRKLAIQPQRTVLTHRSEPQQRLISIWGLEREKHHELG